jgi:hypothetical protein
MTPAQKQKNIEANKPQTPEQKAKATLCRHGRAGGLVRDLNGKEIAAFAAIEGNDARAFDVAWSQFTQRLADAKATVEGADEPPEPPAPAPAPQQSTPVEPPQPE